MQLGRPGALVCSDNGTLGLLVKKPGSPELYVLSCSHVVAKSGRFGFPFEALAESQRVVQQPATCNAKENRVGLLTKTHSRLKPPSEGENTEDCGLVLLDAAIAATASPVQAITGNSISQVAREHPSEWKEGMRTRLLGAQRTAGASFGSILRLVSRQEIRFPGLGNVVFKNVVLYKTECSGGDSGGGVIDNQNRLLGMHIGGDPAARVGVFMPLAAWMDKEGLELA